MDQNATRMHVITQALQIQKLL